MSAPPLREDRSLWHSLTGFATVGGATVLACLLLVALWWLFGGRRADAPRVRVGVLASPAYEPLAVARAHGALDGAQVLVVEFGSREDMRNAFLDGNVHAVVLPLDDALRLAGPPQEARLLGFVAMSRESLALMTLPGGPSLASLRGRRVGLESGPLGVTALTDMLAPSGFGPRELELRLVDVDGALERMRERGVDAVLVSGAERAQIRAAGGVELARWTPGEQGEPYALFASARAVKLAAGSLAHLVAAWDSGAVQLARREPADLALVARRERIALDDVPRALDGIAFVSAAESRRLLGDAGRAELAAWRDVVARRWRRVGITDRVPPPDAWIASLPGARP